MTFFQFDIRRTKQKPPFSTNSHWTITAAALPRINHIRRYETNITWTTHYHIRWLSTSHENDPRLRRWWYHGTDSPTGHKETVMKKWVYSKIKSRQLVLCFTFDSGYVELCKFLQIFIWGYYVSGDLKFISNLHMF